MRRIPFIALPLLLAACDSSPKAVEVTPPEVDLGHCTYKNKFSKSDECREYKGSGWTEASVGADCTDQGGAISAGACARAEILGTCALGADKEKTVTVVFPGDDATKCNGDKLGCESFGGGTFSPEGPCKGDTPVDPNATVFHPPKLICKDPIAGEPPGLSEGGKVCTWEMISGCTEPDRKFIEYASCEPVYTQRPYYPVPAPAAPTTPDARLNDPVYKGELDWVKAQVQAAACVCCHQTSITPMGASIWDIEAKGNWMDSFTPHGLAFAGGFIPSWPLGAYPKSENNGFSRDVTGLPTTDTARMQAFFKAELEHRGLSVDQYKNSDPTPAFFYDQSTYQPKACEAGSGISAGGTITWSGGPARYLYVLSADADNPGVPPNLDVPAGTVWKVDVSPDAAPVKTGTVSFGKVPTAATQAFPKGNSAPAVTSGKTYYLYVLADVGAPITRCLFTAP